MRSFITAALALGTALGALTSCQLIDPQQQQPHALGDCALKPCGEPCRVCDPNDPGCVETAELKFCQIDGTCAPLTPTCGAENPCAVTLCPVNTTCVVLETYPPQAQCVGVDPCAAVQCPTGSQCANGVCSPVQTGVPCGGLSGTRCPGAGSCIDDPLDTCTPQAGGRDCAGICRCALTGSCPPGNHWDDSPSVCACAPDEPSTPCGSDTCGADEFCCNASCGTCAPIGGACIQVFCPPTQ